MDILGFDIFFYLSNGDKDGLCAFAKTVKRYIYKYFY